MIFIGFAFIFLGLLANDGWPGMLLGGGLMVEFDAEMGSERDSWKGGVIGTSQTMLPGETVAQSIDRFLAEAQETHRWDK